MMKTSWLTAALWVIGIVLHSPALADRWYHVELIVFSNTNPIGGVIGSASEFLDLEGAIELQGPGNSQDPDRGDFQLLNRTAYQLTGVRQKLQSSPNYNPLLHVAWRQPGLYSAKARKVHISSQAQPLAQLPEYKPAVEGSAQLSVGRFLHLELNLLHRRRAPTRIESQQQAPPNPDGTAKWVTARLRQYRRMRSGQLHYFDHPLFGVLALIRPYGSPAS